MKFWNIGFKTEKKVFTHHSIIPAFQRSNGFGSSFNIHRSIDTDILTVNDERNPFFLGRWCLEA